MGSEEIKSKVEEYLGLFDDIKARAGDERTAVAILQEVNKDMRMAQIRAERANGNGYGNGDDALATEKQKNFMKKLGINIPKGLTKKEASALIDEELGKESEQGSFRNVARHNVPIPWYAAPWDKKPTSPYVINRVTNNRMPWYAGTWK